MSAIAVIGAGNLGAAIARGLVAGRHVEPDRIVACRRQIDRLESLRALGVRTTGSVAEAIADARVVLICVQPNQLGDIAAALRGGLRRDQHLVISTITGVGLEELAREIGIPGMPVFRAMPNTAIAVGESMTCLCSQGASEDEVAECRRLFAHLGAVVEIEERLMKAATVLAASNVAFVMRMIRAITQGGIQLGFHSEDAQAIATQVVKGAAVLLHENHSHPEMEIDRVTTPRGCTIEGLNEMEHQGLSSAIIRGLVASYDKIARIRD